MKVIIAGSRNITDYNMIEQVISKSKFNITEVVCGCAIGVDRVGQQWAKNNSIKIEEMPANWNKHGRAAGPIRNSEMAKYADAAIIIWDGKSPGSKNMIDQMRRLNKPYELYDLSQV